MNEKMRRFIPKRTEGFLLIACLLALWELSARYWIASSNWPPVSSVFAAGAAAMADGELPRVFVSSLSRMLVGFIIGSTLGIALGLLMGRSRLVFAAFMPLIEFMRPIPIPAIIPPLILLLGIGTGMKLFVVAFGVFTPVLINTLAGVRAVDSVALDVARTFQVSSTRSVLRVVLPSSMPYIMSGLRTSMAFALIITVIAEMIAGSEGIGYHIATLQYALRASDMYAAIILLAICGYLLNFMAVSVEKRVLHWFQRST